MLKKYQKAIAASIAKDLLEEGMVWGEELETYIKLNAKGLMVFENDEHYLEFENYFLGCIERTITRDIQVRQNESAKIVNTIKDAAIYSGVSAQVLYKGLKNKKFSIMQNNINIEFEILRPRLDMI